MNIIEVLKARAGETSSLCAYGIAGVIGIAYLAILPASVFLTTEQYTNYRDALDWLATGGGGLALALFFKPDAKK